MASLVRDAKGRSPFWYCAFTAIGKDGKLHRLKKSTGETSKSKAQKICVQWQRATDMARQRTLTEERAREVISEILASVNGGEGLRSFTVRQWFEHFYKVKQKASDPATAAKYAQIKRDFLAFLGTKADLNVLSVTSHDARSFRDEREKTGVSATTLNDSLTILSAYFNGARKAHVISDNPCLGIEAVTDTVTPAKRRKKPFTVEQVKALVAAASDDWRGLIKTAFYTGARLENCANLRFRDLDFTADPPVVVFPNYSKHGDEHEVPMHSALEECLLKLSPPKGDRTGAAFLLPSLAERRTANLSKQFRKLMQEARIQNWKVREGVRGKGKSAARDVWALGFHSFRRTNVSTLANAGVPEEQRMAITAHATRDVHKGYTHHELAQLRRAIAHLPTL
jgi:integrase